MSLFRDDAGKTEKATPKRLDQARDKGRTPISRELVMGGTLLLAVVVLELTGSWLIGAFETLLRDAMALPRDRIGATDTPWIMQMLLDVALTVAPPVAFLMGIFVAATLLFGYGQIGIKVSKKAVGFKPEQLNPTKNLQKLFSFSSLTRTGLSAMKLVVLGSVLYLVLRAKWKMLGHLHEIDDLQVSLGFVAELAFTILFWIAFIVVLLALLDVAWQRYDFHKSLMMSKKEVDDERKSTEGDPMIKNRIKQARLALARQRIAETVPKADVVITNPTHYAVAIKYDRSSNAAPEVLAKGVDELALKMREIAEEHGVPVMEDPPLARALFRAVKIGQEIPEKFYKAVATVLSHVYRMNGRVA